MPRNVAGKPIDPTINRNDGFSPGSPIVTRSRAWTRPRSRRTGLRRSPTPTAIARRNHPAVLIDARTGKRQPFWAELDARAGKRRGGADARDPPGSQLQGGPALHRRPARPQGADGSAIAPGAASRPTATATASDARRAAHMDRLFSGSRRRGSPATTCIWRGTSRSPASATCPSGCCHPGRRVRQARRHDLGDPRSRAPRRSTCYRTPEGRRLRAVWPARRRREAGESVAPVAGSVHGAVLPRPAGCPPSRRSSTDALAPTRSRGASRATPRPRRSPASIPRVLSPARGRPAGLLYGHGLLGDAEPGDRRAPGRSPPSTTSSPAPATGAACRPGPAERRDDARRPLQFPIADRPRAAGHAQLPLPRPGMVHPDGFSGRSAFQRRRARRLSTPRGCTTRHSQGGIMGGSLTAVAPDFKRAVLGVPAMNYSTLLQRWSTSTPTRGAVPRVPERARAPAGLLAPAAVGPRRGQRLRAPHDRDPLGGHAGPRR